jgi:hypothetical protein
MTKARGSIGAFLNNADLSATGLEATDLSGSRYNCDTIFPPGFVPDAEGMIDTSEGSFFELQGGIGGR